MCGEEVFSRLSWRKRESAFDDGGLFSRRPKWRNPDLVRARVHFLLRVRRLSESMCGHLQPVAEEDEALFVEDDVADENHNFFGARGGGKTRDGESEQDEHAFILHGQASIGERDRSGGSRRKRRRSREGRETPSSAATSTQRDPRGEGEALLTPPVGEAGSREGSRQDDYAEACDNLFSNVITSDLLGDDDIWPRRTASTLLNILPAGKSLSGASASSRAPSTTPGSKHSRNSELVLLCGRTTRAGTSGSSGSLASGASSQSDAEAADHYTAAEEQRLLDLSEDFSSSSGAAGDAAVINAGRQMMSAAASELFDLQDHLRGAASAGFVTSPVVSAISSSRVGTTTGRDATSYRGAMRIPDPEVHLTHNASFSSSGSASSHDSRGKQDCGTCVDSTTGCWGPLRGVLRSRSASPKFAGVARSSTPTHLSRSVSARNASLSPRSPGRVSRGSALGSSGVAQRGDLHYDHLLQKSQSYDSRWVDSRSTPTSTSTPTSKNLNNFHSTIRKMMRKHSLTSRVFESDIVVIILQFLLLPSTYSRLSRVSKTFCSYARQMTVNQIAARACGFKADRKAVFVSDRNMAKLIEGFAGSYVGQQLWGIGGGGQITSDVAEAEGAEEQTQSRRELVREITEAQRKAIVERRNRFAVQKQDREPLPPLDDRREEGENLLLHDEDDAPGSSVEVLRGQVVWQAQIELRTAFIPVGRFQNHHWTMTVAFVLVEHSDLILVLPTHLLDHTAEHRGWLKVVK